MSILRPKNQSDECNSNGSDGAHLIDIDERNIYLYDTITNKIAVEVADAVYQLNIKNPESPVYLYINSPGGYLDDSIAIISSLKQREFFLITNITGAAYSGAAMISLCGDHRVMSEYGNIMFHAPQWDSDKMSLGEHEQDVQVTKEQFDRVMKGLILGTKFDYNKFKKNDKDVYITPKKALSDHIVHEVY